MLMERLGYVPDRLADFALAPDAAARDAWRALPEDVAGALVSGGERALAASWPALPASLYLDYTKNGDRVRFETAYFGRRRLVNDLILAECVEAQGRFIPAIVDALWSLSEESGWQLPAHNSHVRGGPRHPLPDPDRPVIDLFAAETGALIAVALHLLGPRLDDEAPGLTLRLFGEVRRRIMDPYLQQHFWWMGKGDEPMNNWTVWSTQNVLWAAFILPFDERTRRAVLEKAAYSIDCFLKDYGDDGACEEGAQYYRHAGLCLFNALATLATVAPEAFTPIFREAKIRNIAEYIVHVYVAGRAYINFADCGAICEPAGAREFLFGEAVGSAMLMDFAASDWADGGHIVLAGEINLGYRLQAIFSADRMRRHTAQSPAKPDIFFPSVGLFIARDSRFVLAVKAGDNGDSHNHNDTGSLTVYRDGKPLLIDVGVGTYTAKTFSAQRYDIWTMQSAFHNLPSFGGVMQQDGEAFHASDVEVLFEPQEASISFELSKAYPKEARLRSYRRRVGLIREERITLHDHYEGDLPAELNLMVAKEPRLADDGFFIGGLGFVAVEGAGQAMIDEIAIEDARLRLSWPERIWRVRLAFKDRDLKLTIGGSRIDA